MRFTSFKHSCRSCSVSCNRTGYSAWRNLLLLLFRQSVYLCWFQLLQICVLCTPSVESIQDPDTGVPLSEPSGSSLPVCMHHTVRPRSLPAICRSRSPHGTSIPSGALRPPLFLCCRPSSVERTADPSERVPIVPVIQGQTKNSPLPPRLQRPCVVLVTFVHFPLF